jgi:PilZ domain
LDIFADGRLGLDMDERRRGTRHVISFPIRVNWKDEDGKKLVEEGLTENVGPRGALVFLPRSLPEVGMTVRLTITENPDNEITVPARVLRLERNVAHPQAALEVTRSFKVWKEKVWSFAGDILDKEKPDEFEDW